MHVRRRVLGKPHLGHLEPNLTGLIAYMSQHILPLTALNLTEQHIGITRISSMVSVRLCVSVSLAVFEEEKYIHR